MTPPASRSSTTPAAPGYAAANRVSIVSAKPVHSLISRGVRGCVGVSTHDIDQARRARDDGADLIGCGPMFPSETKAFDEFVGPKFIADVTAAMTLPAFAIGGITAENASQISGGRVAVSRAITHAEQPEHAARQLKAALAAAESPTA